MNIYIKLFFSIYIIIIISKVFCDDKLRWTFELVNHGARTPHFGLDVNYKDFMGHLWIGQNELSGVGLRQSFLVGYRDRLRYIEEKKLISDTYDPREIFIYASENNKTLMTASSLMHGIFLPGTGPQIDPSLVDRAVPPVDPSSYIDEKKELDNDNYTALPGRMNLVPVHISFSHEYFTQFENSKKCVGLKKYEESNKNRKEVIDFLEKVTEKYGGKLISIFKDKDENLLKDYEFAYYVFDTILCLYFEGAEEFDQITKTLGTNENDLLKDCYDFLFMNIVGNSTDSKEYIDYLVSPVFHKILKYIDYKIEKDSKGEIDYKGYDLPKYFILSGVSNSLGAFMSFMNKYFGTQIKYSNFSTNLHLELYLEEKDNKHITESDYRIEYYYNDDFLLSIPYKEFKEKIKYILVDQIELNQFCKVEEKRKEQEIHIYWYYYLIGSIIIVGIIIIILYIIISKKKNNNKLNEEVEDKDNLIRETNRTTKQTN